MPPHGDPGSSSVMVSWANLIYTCGKRFDVPARKNNKMNRKGGDILEDVLLLV
jgi:hypothetical protein